MGLPDHLVRGVTESSSLRVTCAVTRSVVEEARRRHKLVLGTTVALGKALTSGLLLATLTKNLERVTVQLAGDGPIGRVTVDANGSGDVRGYVTYPEAEAQRSDLLLGRIGVVNVTRDLGLRDLYQGQVSLTTGEVDEDIEAYLRISEQVPSALGCEVAVVDGKMCAAGILVQALPGGDPQLVREVQHALRTGRFRELVLGGEQTAQQLAAGLVGEEPIEWLDERPVQFACPCSDGRITNMLRMLPPTELDEMAAADKPAEIICNFCNAVYLVERAELEEIRRQVAPRESN